jgi:uncharacterized protein (TIGR03435 family)
MVLAWLVATGAAGLAQTANRASFEVASVRLGDSRTPPSRTITDARVDLSNYPTREVLMMAFRVEAFRVVSPDWLQDHRLEIHATIPAGATRDQVPEMLQSLLAERLGLVAHMESRPTDVYELTVGQGGIRMREVEPVDGLARPYSDPSGQPPIIDSVSGPPENRTRTTGSASGRMRVATSTTLYETQNTERRARRVEATRMTMEQLVGLVRSSVDKPVVDRTGLTGGYQFTVELPPAAGAARVAQRLGLTRLDGEPIDVDASGTSVFKAVEILGLKLDQRKAPLEFLVVDRIERSPVAN